MTTKTGTRALLQLLEDAKTEAIRIDAKTARVLIKRIGGKLPECGTTVSIGLGNYEMQDLLGNVYALRHIDLRKLDEAIDKEGERRAGEGKPPWGRYR